MCHFAKLPLRAVSITHLGDENALITTDRSTAHLKETISQIAGTGLNNLPAIWTGDFRELTPHRHAVVATASAVRSQ